MTPRDVPTARRTRRAFFVDALAAIIFVALLVLFALLLVSGRLGQY